MVLMERVLRFQSLSTGLGRPMRLFLSLALIALTTPALAEVPVLRVQPNVGPSAQADRSDVAAWQAAMPSIEVRAAFLAEKDDRGPEGEHIPRADNRYASGEEVYFYVSMRNISRDPAIGPDGAFAIALRAQLRYMDGEPLGDWNDIHTYTGTMTMTPDSDEYFWNFVTGGLGPELPPGQYQLALEFTDVLRAEPVAQVPVEVVFDLLYPDQ